MTEQRTATRKVSSFVTPTEDDLAYFESLPANEQRALLQAEIDKGFAGGLGNRTFDEIVAEARAASEGHRSSNG